MKKNFEVTRILPYKPTLLFEQIADFERYEQYLPFCNASRSLNTDNKDFSQIGELEFEIAGVNYKIKSGNIIEDERILITQIKGPFKEMRASWDVEQIDDGSEDDEIVGDDFESMYKGEISKSGTPILPSKRARKTPEKMQVSQEDLAELSETAKPDVDVSAGEETMNEQGEVSLDEVSEQENQEAEAITEDSEASNS